MAHENATPRPWSLEDGNPLTIVADQGDDYPWFIATAHEGMRETKANAAFIVEAVNAYDPLRAEVARLEAENAKLREQNATLLEALKPFADRGNFTARTQMVTLGSCQRARAVYDAAHVTLFGAVVA